MAKALVAAAGFSADEEPSLVRSAIEWRLQDERAVDEEAHVHDEAHEGRDAAVTADS